jgi:hypothetical protein
LMILTPLGLLATGAALGEWRSGGGADPQAREWITAASGNQAPPAQAPKGEIMVHLARRAGLFL